MPQVVEAEVLDAGTLLRLVPRGGALLDSLTSEGEAPARVLSPRRFERRHGIRVQGNAAAVTGLGRAVIAHSVPEADSARTAGYAPTVTIRPGPT